MTGLLQVVGALTSLFSMTAFLGGGWWLFDITSHFRVQYLAILLVVTGIGAMRGMHQLASLCLFSALLDLFAIRTLWIHPHDDTRSDLGAPVFRTLLLNVRTENQDKARCLAFLQKSDADIIALSEADNAWADALAPLRKSHPQVLSEPRDDNFGLIMFSRFPVKRSQVVQLGEAEVPTIEADLELPGGIVRLFITHPLPPGSRENTRLRDGQLALLAERVSRLDGTVVVLGDLNTTPWGSSFRDFKHVSGLNDTSEGQGWQPTWPTAFPFMLIPLDHAFTTSDLRVVERRIGPGLGSDHYPLLVDLAWRRRSAPAGVGGTTR